MKKNNIPRVSSSKNEPELTPKEREMCKLKLAESDLAASDKRVDYLKKHVTYNDPWCINPKEFAEKAHLGENLIQRLYNGQSHFTHNTYLRIALGFVIFLDKLAYIRTQKKHQLPTPEQTEHAKEEILRELKATFGPYADTVIELKRKGFDLDLMARYLKKKASHNPSQPTKKNAQSCENI